MMKPSRLKHLAAAILAGCMAMALPSAQGQEATTDPALENKLDRILLEIERTNLNVEKAGGAKGGASSEELAKLQADLAALQTQMGELKAGGASAATAAPADTGVLEALEAKLQKNINSVWLVTTAALVFLMQAGFCILETGMVRAKNGINVSMKVFMGLCCVILVYLFVGFGLMYGNSVSGIIANGPYWLSQYKGSSPLWAFWLFQVMFCAASTAIASGAMAERTKFMGYMIFSVVFGGVFYAIGGHWAWGGMAEGLEQGFGVGKGWLAQMGFIDFAGSTVVHTAGGAAALAGVMILGPRTGRFAADGSPRLIPPHNVPLATLGVFLLWFGWFGFNAGSTLIGNADIGRIASNTTIAAAAGAIIAMISSWKVEGRPDALVAMNGALAGLVAITACCAVVTPISAVALGAIAGLITTYGALFIEKFGIDDVAGAVPVHLFSGVWGTLSAAIFNEAGFKWEMLGVQALGAFTVGVTTFLGSLVVFKLCAIFGVLRAPEREQEDGLDFTEHGANAYADFEISSR